MNFVCLKWGTKYSAEYVNRLYRAVDRQFSQPFRFYCITDDPSGIDPAVLVRPLLDDNLVGWWHKLTLFKDEVHDIRGRTLFLDLDVVIVDSLDWLTDYPGGFCIIKNWTRWGGFNSSAFRFDIGSQPQVWRDFSAVRRDILARIPREARLFGDQDWLRLKINTPTYWPPERIVSYKKGCASRGRPLCAGPCRRLGLTTARTEKAVIPPDASIIVFHGRPDPEEVMNSSWGEWKHAPWIREHWY